MNSGVAAEADELKAGWCLLLFIVPIWCFPIQGSVYSPFNLFEDQVLNLSGVSSIVLSGLLTLLF